MRRRILRPGMEPLNCNLVSQGIATRFWSARDALVDAAGLFVGWTIRVANKDDELTLPATGKLTARRKPIKKDDNMLGGALRAAYQDAVEETIPQEMLDLLGRLS